MATFQEMHDQAGARYKAAVLELRAAYGLLGALDRKVDAQGFGIPVDVVSLRHRRYAPDISGSFADDVAAALARL